MKKIKLIIVMFLLGLPFFSQANSEDAFPISTEMQIGKMRNLIDRAPGGIYLTVGGERAFRGASMYEKIKQLIIVDVSTVIVRFNKINIELLKAINKEQYKNLRWNADFKEWRTISALLTEDDFKWWNKNIRNIKGHELPESLNKTGTGNRYIKIREKLLAVYPRISERFNNRKSVFLKFVTWEDIKYNQIYLKIPLTKAEFDFFDSERKDPNSCVVKFIENPETAVDWGQVIDYKSGNYLFDDKLYNRLHDLALKNKIIVLEADLSSDSGIKVITQVLKKENLEIGVLDLNNLYLYEYMGEKNFRKVLSNLLGFGTYQSILILIDNYKDYPCAQFSIYIGFTFEHVKSWAPSPFLDKFISSIPFDIKPLLDGRLYEGKDEIPFYLMRME